MNPLKSLFGIQIKPIKWKFISIWQRAFNCYYYLWLNATMPQHTLYSLIRE